MDLDHDRNCPPRSITIFIAIGRSASFADHDSLVGRRLPVFGCLHPYTERREQWSRIRELEGEVHLRTIDKVDTGSWNRYVYQLLSNIHLKLRMLRFIADPSRSSKGSYMLAEAKVRHMSADRKLLHNMKATKELEL